MLQVRDYHGSLTLLFRYLFHDTSVYFLHGFKGCIHLDVRIKGETKLKFLNLGVG